MSFWQIIKALIALVTGHRRYTKSMGQLRTYSLQSNAIEAVLDAYRRGDYRAALDAAQSMKDNPQLAASYFFFSGIMLMNLGRFQEAEQLLRRHLTAAPDDKRAALANSSLGHLLVELERYDEAMDCFQASLRHWPNRGSAHRDIAEACLRRGGPVSEAFNWAQLAVQEDRARDNPTGSPQMQEVCDINLAEDLATLAWAVAAGSRDRAQVDRLVDEAVSLVGTSASPAALVRCHAGLAYCALGDAAKSDEHFREAIRIDPHGLRGRSARALTTSVNA